MEKPHSNNFYEQASNQDKEAESHAHKTLTEVSAWFQASSQANQMKTEALQQTMSENVNTMNMSIKRSCDAASGVLNSLSTKIKQEDPELLSFLHKAQHAPETAFHRIAEFYKTRPVTAAVETIIPPIALVDGLVRGGLPQYKVAKHLSSGAEIIES